MVTPAKNELKSIGYELFIGALSVLSIVNLVALNVFAYDPNIENVILTINAVMTPIFLGDFIYRILTAEPKGDYFWRGFGWADLLSSLPFPQARLLRVFRLWRVVRLFVKFGARNLARQFIEHRAENALLTVVFLVICVLQFGALAILSAEMEASNGNIKNASDALWWAYVSITTVGYGDRFPVTNSGRIIGLFVLTAGVGLFGTLSGFLANAFLAPARKESEQDAATDVAPAPGAPAGDTGAATAVTAPVTAPVNATEGGGSAVAAGSGEGEASVAAQVESMRSLLAAQEAAMAELRATLDALAQRLA